MATSSIFHNFVIDGEENVRRFIEAYEATLDAPVIPTRVREITDPEELKVIFAKQRQHFDARKRLEAEQNAV
ncbi:MAG: hypothetical protein IJS28_02415 [Synergistaceae bacterium]|nr:hypothetical protein [Synergistaceae bacterium]